MKQYLLGIDIGTSACKAAVFDRNGEVIASASEEYPVYYPHPGWAEQDPRDWWRAVCTAIRRMAADRVDLSEIAGVGIDGLVGNSGGPGGKCDGQDTHLEGYQGKGYL